MAAVAVRAARGPIAVRPVDVSLARLPARHEGFRLVQLTDIHVGPTIGRAFVEDIVRRTNALAPDLIAITGDLVDGTVEQLRDAVAPLADLRARHGVFFVTGNHEYFSGAGPWLAELPRLGMRVLRNERVSIGEGADAFDLAGVDDHSARRYGGLAPEAAIAGALDGRDPARELVLLAHQPRSLRGARRSTASACSSPDTRTAARSGPSAFSCGWLSRSSPGSTGKGTRRSTSAAAPATGVRRCASARQQRSPC